MVEKHRYKIQNRLSSFTYWLYDEKFLGLQKVIDDILKPLETKLSEEEKNKHIFGANVLRSNGKITESQYNNFIDKLSNRTLIYTDENGDIDPKGKWHYVNKLNTNYYDLAELLTELLIRSYNNNSVVSESIIRSLIGKSSDDETKNVLLKHKHKLPQLFNDYLKSPQELLKFTNAIQRTSMMGEKLEDDIVKRLTDIGYDVIYQGGNGDYIDMVYSIDFIIKGKDKVYTVQSKTTQNQVDKFINDIGRGKYKEVDLLIYPSNTKYKIFMVKDKVTKEIEK